MTKDEHSVMSRPCNRKFDYAYDSCIYETKYKLIAERFNCTFNLFVNSANISSKNNLEECKLIDVSRNVSARFRDIIKDIGQGN